MANRQKKIFIDVKKKREKKKKSFPPFRTFVFLSYTLHSKRKWTRAQTYRRIKQNRSSFAGYLKTSYWYVGIPPGCGSTRELVHRCTTSQLRIKAVSCTRQRLCPAHTEGTFSNYHHVSCVLQKRNLQYIRYYKQVHVNAKPLILLSTLKQVPTRQWIPFL